MTPRAPILPQIAMAAVCLAGLLAILLGLNAIGRTFSIGVFILAFGTSVTVLQLLAWLRHTPNSAMFINILLMFALFLTIPFLIVLICFLSGYAFLLLPPMAALFAAMVANSEWEKFQTFRTASTRHLCPHCHYDLRSTPDPTGPLLPQCPECGHLAKR